MFIDALGGLVADTGVALATEARTTFILLHEIFIMTWTGSSRHLLNSWKEEERYCSWLRHQTPHHIVFGFLRKRKWWRRNGNMFSLLLLLLAYRFKRSPVQRKQTIFSPLLISQALQHTVDDLGDCPDAEALDKLEKYGKLVGYKPYYIANCWRRRRSRGRKSFGLFLKKKERKKIFFHSFLLGDR